MVFACLKCGSRFRVADDRLAGKVLRFACPKCGQGHLLRDPAVHESPVEAVTPSQATTGPASHPGDRRPPPPSAPTRHPTISEVRLTQSAPTVVPKAAPEPAGAPTHPTTRTGALPAVPAAKPTGTESWYAIRHGQRVGPFNREELLERLLAGDLHQQSFLWRPTMAAWTRLNQIPDLADLRDAVPRARTAPPAESGPSQPVPAPPLPPGVAGGGRAGPEDDSELPPPLPPHREPPRAGKTSLPHDPDTARAVGSEPVDALYSKISRPAIDLRKIREVQPEEPEIPDAPSRPRADRLAPLARPLQLSQAPLASRPPSAPAVEPAPAPREDHSPTGLAVTQDEKRFFSRAFVLPSEAWPGAPVAEPVHEAEPLDAGPAVQEVRAGGRPRERVPRLQDFSVMVRLTRRSKRRTLVLFGSLGVLMGVVIGLVLYWSFSAGPAEVGIAVREDGEVPTFRQTLYAVPKSPKPEEIAPALPQADERRRPAGRSSGSNGASGARIEVPEPKLARAPEVDPTLNAEFQRYAGILGTGNNGRTETVVDVKPRTLTEMPQHRFDRDGMDAFLSTKMRKFSDCKARMKRKTDLPVKVVLGFSVGLDGKVHDIVVDQAAGPRDDGLDECIRRIVSGWAFPPPDEEATIRTTLLL